MVSDTVSVRVIFAVLIHFGYLDFTLLRSGAGTNRIHFHMIFRSSSSWASSREATCTPSSAPVTLAENTARTSSQLIESTPSLEIISWQSCGLAAPISCICAMYSPFRVDTACVTLVPVPAGSELKNSPKQEPETIAIKQINRIISTATQPPAAMAVINPFTAAMVALDRCGGRFDSYFCPGCRRLCGELFATCAAFCVALPQPLLFAGRFSQFAGQS